MDMLLLGITIVSLIVAFVMSLLAMRVSRDEKQRSAARVAALLFSVGYVALDAISGIAASAILASGAAWSKEATRALFASEPAALPTVVAVLAWRVSVVLAAWALYRAGRPLAPLVLLVASAVWLNNDHGGVRGVVVFGGFAVAVAWLEYFPGWLRRRGPRGTSAA